MQCKKCGSKDIAKYPLYIEKGGTKIIQWQNLFKMSAGSVIFLLLIAAMTWMYIHDTRECFKIIEDPIKYCYTSNACKIISENIEAVEFKFGTIPSTDNTLLQNATQ